MSDILFSIITPVFNRADCVERCIKSVVRNLNSGVKFEHIIVDDGSTDTTSLIVEEYAKQYPHVVFAKFDHNRGTNAARNEAIRRARGKWCIILDSDDYFVDDAIQTIASTMKEQPSYKHYMFAPDDMQEYYAQNSIIQGVAQKELTYPDFLSGYVAGDFIHICFTDILRAHPFNEYLRIYEGVFFLMFFRDAQRMLFTNKVVTIRERSRKDSVTRDVLRTNKKAIEREIIAKELLLKTFKTDFENMRMFHRLYSVQVSLYENYILIGDYGSALRLKSDLKKCTLKKFYILNAVCFFRLGIVYRLMLGMYSKMKYGLLKRKLK